MSDDVNTDGAGQPGGEPNGGQPSGGEPGGDAKWFDGLSDDLKGNEQLTGLDGVETLAKSYLETLGKLPVVPAEAKDYGLELDGLADDFLKLGMTAEQGKGVEAALKATSAKLDEEIKAEIEAMDKESLDYLNKQYKDQAAEKRDAIIDGLKGLMPADKAEGLAQFIATPYIGSNPFFIQLADIVMHRVAPDTLLNGGQNRSGDGTRDTSDAARASRMFSNQPK